ncbi:MAG: amidohydrolase [Actinobacteria bacterium]|nr:amidohydrolase [Actinomycetota bacterium]
MGFPLVDADEHYYEPRDAFTRHMPKALAHLAVHVEGAGDDERVMIGDQPFTFLRQNYDRVVKPGALREMLRTMKSGLADETGTTVEEDVAPAYLDRDARLAVMDEQGVEATLLFPTLAVCVEHFMKDDPAQLYANFEAFNRWLEDDWGYAYRDRIFAAPLMSLRDVDLAVAELDRVLALGARVISLRPGPAFGRSPADPVFDPFWARVDEAGVLVGLHIGESGYNELYSTAWGEEANPDSHHQSALQWSCFYGDRPIMETIAAMVLHNLFGRFPNIRVASVENGSLWVPYLLAQLDKMKGMGRNGPWPGGYVEGKPSEVVKRHVFVSPYHEEDIPALAHLIGPGQVLFGSDFPHPEGLASPIDYAEGLKGLTDEEIRMIMRENTAGLLR